MVQDQDIALRIDAVVAKKFRDREDVADAIANKAEDLLWTKVKRYFAIFTIMGAVIFALLAFVGIHTYKDTVGRVNAAVGPALEQAKAAAATIKLASDQTSKIAPLLNKIQAEASNAEASVEQTAARITPRLAALLRNADAAQAQINAQLARTAADSKNLASLEQSLTNSSARLGQQVDRTELAEVYPGIGQPTYITYGGFPWRGAATKPSGQVWLSMFIFADMIPSLTPSGMNNLMSALRSKNVLPFLKPFGTQGAVSGLVLTYEVGPAVSTVVYFSGQKAQLAKDVAEICTKALGFPVDTELFVPTATTSPTARIVAEQSGLDLQLVIRAPPPGLRARQ